MKDKVLKYVNKHDGFCPSFTVIFAGRQAVVSIKHRGTEYNLGHKETTYGFLFWLRLALNIRKCFKQQINHE